MNNAKRQSFINAARAQIGKPWKHAQSSEQAVDCVGLLAFSAKVSGILIPDLGDNRPRNTNDNSLVETLSTIATLVFDERRDFTRKHWEERVNVHPKDMKRLAPIIWELLEPADVLCYQFDCSSFSHHAALYAGEKKVIQAHRDGMNNQVLETPLCDRSFTNLKQIFRFEF